MVKTCLAATILLLASLTFAGVRDGPARPIAPTTESAAREAIRKRVPAVGRIIVRSGPGFVAAGSAVMIEATGLVVTTLHQVQDKNGRIAEDIFLTLPSPEDNFGGLDKSKKHRLTLFRASPVYDLALLTIDNRAGAFAFVPFADPQSVHLLDPVYILGYPELGGDSITISRGIIAGRDDWEGWFKLDTHLVHGYSGGAVLNERGELLGVPVQKRVDYSTLNLSEESPQATMSVSSIDFVRPVSVIRQLRTSEAAGPAVVVAGQVIGATGNAVAGALIALLQGRPQVVNHENLLAYRWTADDGAFSLSAAAEDGDYTIRVKASGFRIKDQVVRIKDGKSPALKLELEPEK